MDYSNEISLLPENAMILNSWSKKAEDISKEDIESHLCCSENNFKFFKLLQEKRWMIIENSIEESPEKIKERYEFFIHGEKFICNFLHAVCRFQPPFSLVDSITGICPSIVSEKEENTLGLPIHFSCRFKASLSVVKLLVDTYPQGLKIRDDTGFLPIHYACCFGSDEVIKYLLYIYPESTNEGDNEGKLPIHLVASRTDVSRSLINYTASINESLLRKKDHKGSLPIHLAVCHKAPERNIILLLQLYPHSIFARDRKGRTPLDITKILSRYDESREIREYMKSLRLRIRSKKEFFIEVLHFISKKQILIQRNLAYSNEKREE